ncbi:MAG: histidine kinase [Burkholderiales bacterium]
MSSVLHAPSPAGFAPRAAGRGPLAGFGRRHLILILGFTVLTPLTFALFGLAFDEPVHALALGGETLMFLAIGCASVCSALASDNLLRHRMGPVGSLVVATLAASIVSVALIELAMHAVIGPLGWDIMSKLEAKGITGAGQRVFLEFVGALRWALVLVALYELLESSRRADQELHTARMTALAAQQNLVEGELRAMQARVDPELLFNSLVAIDQGYAEGVECGQQRLDELIRFLRAALPSDSAGTSTVLREQELVEAYVALLRQRAPEVAELQVRVDPDAQAEQMPSMLLLPLVRWALAAKSARHLRLRIRRQAASLAIEVEGDAQKDEAAPLDEIASVRQRLTQLYAQGAHLSIASGAGPWRALLEIPRPQLAGATASSR